MAHDVTMTGEAQGSPHTREEGPDVSVPVLVPDGESGTHQAAAKANGAAGEVRPAKRKGGRKPGMPKVPGSGLQKGQRKTFNRDLKELILSRGRPVDLLCNVSRGLKIRVGPQAGPGEPTYVYPDLQTRLYAARTLLAKVLPDVKAIEVGGIEDGAPLVEPTRCYELYSTTEAARRIAFILAKATQD